MGSMRLSSHLNTFAIVSKNHYPYWYSRVNEGLGGFQDGLKSDRMIPFGHLNLLEWEHARTHAAAKFVDFKFDPIR